MNDKLSLGRLEPTHFSNGHDSSMLSDEESFVVLNCSPSNNPSGQFSNPGDRVPSSLKIHPSYPLNATPHMMVPERRASMDRHNSSFVTGSFSSDVSPEEIQKKLSEVLQENVSLKETLYQNNLAMKQQLTTLGTWQAEVAKLHQSHKEKFSETKELIVKLRTENDELKKALKDAGSRTNKAAPPNASESTLIATNASLKSQVAELQNQVSALSLSTKNEQQILKSISSKKEQELIALTEQLNRQLEIAERSRRQLGVDAERLQAQKTRLEREMTTVKADLVVHQQKAVTVETERQKLMQLFNAKEKEMENLKAQLRECQEQVEEMKGRLHDNSNNSTTPDAELTTSLDKQEKKLVEISDDLGKQADTYTSLDSWLNLAAGRVESLDAGEPGDSATVKRLQTEISEVRKMLADEQAVGKERAKTMSETQTEFANLLSHYQKALRDLNASKQNQSSNDRHSSSYHDVQVRGFTEKVDCLTAQVLHLEQDTTQKDRKIAELADRVRELEAENESIPVLQIQMQVYQSDFNAEREARENLAGEKERVAEDLRLLQRRNQQLLNELKLYQQNYTEQQQTSSSVNNGWTTISTPGRNHRRENTPPSPGPFND